MAEIDQLRPHLSPKADLPANLGKAHGVLFVLNVGDADSLVVLLPKDHEGIRRLMVVDAGKAHKTESLIDALAEASCGFPRRHQEKAVGSIPIVIATHPHADHIRGLPGLLREYSHRIVEFWDSGYYHTSSIYLDLMRAVEENPRLVYAQPTAGYRRFFSRAAVTVLGPSVGLRNKYDTYGVRINDASICLAVDLPSVNVTEERYSGDLRARYYKPSAGLKRFILGGDSQTLSWSHILVDFPELRPSNSAAARAIGAASAPRDTMGAHVLKVSHHASKRGVNLEILERINPRYLLVSSDDDSRSHRFPHSITQQIMRESRRPIETKQGAQHPADSTLGVFYTAEKWQVENSEQRPAGSIAVVAGPGGDNDIEIWRLGDKKNKMITLKNLQEARRWEPPEAGQVLDRNPQWSWIRKGGT